MDDKFTFLVTGAESGGSNFTLIADVGPYRASHAPGFTTKRTANWIVVSSRMKDQQEDTFPTILQFAKLQKGRRSIRGLIK